MTRIESGLEGLEKERLLVVFCADQRVALPLAVAFQSLLKQCENLPLDVCVVTEDLSEKDRVALRAVVRDRPRVTLDFLLPPPLLVKRCAGLAGPRAAYFRLLLPELFPTRKHLLYLDVDLLVRRELSTLWELVVSSSLAVQACVDDHPTVSSLAFGSTINLPIYAELGLAASQPYYNSGVLGMNLEKWRQEGLGQKIINFLEKYESRCPFWDQGGINAVLGREIERLPAPWNAYYHRAGIQDYIIHFVSNKKPFYRPKGSWRQRLELAGWHLSQREQPLYKEYFKVVDETAYAGWRPNDLTLVALRAIPVQWLQKIRARRLRQVESSPTKK